MRNGKYLFTSESVTEGHPDKICDQISDSILDEFFKQDPNSRVAVETSVTTGLVFVFGEVTSEAYVDIQKTVRETIKKIGYTKGEYQFDYNSCGIINAIHEQSPDIAMGVVKQKVEDQGAGDQGLMFGYASDETPELMPLPVLLAHKITQKLAEVRKSGKLTYLRPDGKSQVTVEYHDATPIRVDTVVVSTQHDEDVTQEQIKKDVIEYVVKPVCGKWLDSKTIYHINPTGRFVIGGPHGDSGLTGRKIIVDTYGGMGAHGGGAFSGKDPSKVDRSASYYARYVAKNIVAAGLAKRCEVQVAYAIGVAHPVSVLISTFGTGVVSEEKLRELVKNNFDFRPGLLIKELNLRRPIYAKTASYGHFGRSEPEFTWEKTDKAAALRKQAGL